ncbi:hypothetical protein WNZ15_18725 [Roseibium sp. AS2]|uniref:hypothetical protein n=1 Tax=Roseibium sp. AS2 TaxID=3135781 RepID=UPI0031762E06
MPTIVSTMSREPESFSEEEQISCKSRKSASGPNGGLKDNLLLLAGIGLVLLATGMVLSNVLS